MLVSELELCTLTAVLLCNVANICRVVTVFMSAYRGGSLVAVFLLSAVKICKYLPSCNCFLRLHTVVGLQWLFFCSISIDDHAGHYSTIER